MLLIRLASILILPVLWGTAFAYDIRFITHNIEGKTYRDGNGELRGKKHGGRRAFNIELVREMMTLVNHPKRFQEIPFVRGLRTVQDEQDFALFNVTRTAEREETVKWVGPIQKSYANFYELKEAPTGIKTLEDAKKVAGISVLNGNVHHKLLTKHGFTNLQPATSYVSCFKMLAFKRVNLTPSSNLALMERLKAAGISPDEIRRTPVVLFESKGYIAFSKNIPDIVIEKWQQALDQLKRSGKYEQLYQLYLVPD